MAFRSYLIAGIKKHARAGTRRVALGNRLEIGAIPHQKEGRPCMNIKIDCKHSGMIHTIDTPKCRILPGLVHCETTNLAHGDGAAEGFVTRHKRAGFSIHRFIYILLVAKPGR